MTDYQEILDICKRTFQRPKPDGTIPRQFHNKTYACLKGELKIDPPNEQSLRHGLFAKSGRYPALVRFSSSFFEADWHPDVRGMAIKLSGVEGEVCEGAPKGQQDFVLMNEPTGAARNADEAKYLFKAFDGMKKVTVKNIMALSYMIPSLFPLRVRWHYFKFLNSSAMKHMLGRDLGQMIFYSVTPYKLGESAVKYEFHPDEHAVHRRKTFWSKFNLRLQKVLDKGSMGFDFYIQSRFNEDDPIDDACKVWKGPLVRVGYLEIFSQKVEATVELGDNLAFSPWNSLSAHEPLGSINKLRKDAYKASAENRKGCTVFPRQDK